MIFLEKLEIFSCLMMTGVIWVIQLVHYPSFIFIDKENFIKFERFHQKKISLVVLPLMLFEIISHILLLFYRGLSYNLINFSLSTSLLAIWMVTFFVCLPCHQKLSQSFQSKIIQKLIKVNWLRTFFWSLRSILFFLLLTK